MSGDAASDFASIVRAFQRIPGAQDAPFQQFIEADHRIPNAWLGMFIPIEGATVSDRVFFDCLCPPASARRGRATRRGIEHPGVFSQAIRDSLAGPLQGRKNLSHHPTLGASTAQDQAAQTGDDFAAENDGHSYGPNSRMVDFIEISLLSQCIAILASLLEALVQTLKHSGIRVPSTVRRVQLQLHTLEFFGRQMCEVGYSDTGDEDRNARTKSA